MTLAATRAVLEAHLSGRADRGRTLWALLSLQMWAEKWVAGGGSRRETESAAASEPFLTRADS